MTDRTRLSLENHRKKGVKPLPKENNLEGQLFKFHPLPGFTNKIK